MIQTPATAPMCGKLGSFEPTLELGVMSAVRTIGLDLAKTVFR